LPWAKIAANLGQIDRHGGGMRDDYKTDLSGWLRLRRVPDFSTMRWQRLVVFTLAALFAAGLFIELLLLIIKLFVLAVSAALSLLAQGGGSDASAGSLGRGAVIVAVISAPFVIWRSVVAQKTVNVTEQGHITDRINTAVQGLAAQKEVNQIGRTVLFRVSDPDGADHDERQTEIEWKDETIQIPDGMRVSEEDAWQVFTQTQPNLEVRIGAIYALERIAQDSDRDHVQIMEILCAYIRQNAPAPTEDDWPELEIKKGEDDGPLGADWEERLRTFHEAQDAAKAKLKPREDIQAALTVIGRRSDEQRKIEAGPGRGEKALFLFDIPCPEYNLPEEVHDPVALDAYREVLWKWRDILDEYKGHRLDLRNVDLRGADLAEGDLKGAKLDGAFLQGADLRAARFQGAVLKEVRLQGADLAHARLQAADLKWVRLQGADLRYARLQGATPVKAQLQGVILQHAQCQAADFSFTNLQGAKLIGAGFEGADLHSAQLQGASFSLFTTKGTRRGSVTIHEHDFKRPSFKGANLWSAKLYAEEWSETFSGKPVRFLDDADFRGSALSDTDLAKIPIISKQLPSIFADASVKLPGGHGPECKNWPTHWPKFKLDYKVFVEQWRAWQTNPEGYTPPDPPEPEDTA